MKGERRRVAKRRVEKSRFKNTYFSDTISNATNTICNSIFFVRRSFEAIIDPMLDHFETGEKIVGRDDHRMATALKSEMSAFSRQVLPLRDVFVSMADHEFPVHVCTGTDVPEEVMYFEDLRDKR